MWTGFFGGWPKPWTRGSPSVATRRAELPRRLASRRRCPTRGGGSVYRVTSSNVRRPRAVAVAVQFPSFLYRASTSVAIETCDGNLNLKDDGWIVGGDHVASGKREPVPRTYNIVRFLNKGICGNSKGISIFQNQKKRFLSTSFTPCYFSFLFIFEERKREIDERLSFPLYLMAALFYLVAKRNELLRQFFLMVNMRARVDVLTI